MSLSKFAASSFGTLSHTVCCVQKLFWMSEKNSVHNMFSPGLSLEFSCTYWTCNSMKNLSSYCGLVDAKKRVSGNYSPVPKLLQIWIEIFETPLYMYWNAMKNLSVRYYYVCITVASMQRYVVGGFVLSCELSFSFTWC